MEKNIKDYLHLYLGCLYQWHNEDTQWRFPELLTADKLNSINRSGKFGPAWNVRLILRPLSDMTDDEIKYCGNLLCYIPLKTSNYEIEVKRTSNTVGATYRSPDFISDQYFAIWTEKSISGHGHCEIGWYSETAGKRTKESKRLKRNWRIGTSHEVTVYLLAKHFDLFRLIEAGLATDETKPLAFL